MGPTTVRCERCGQQLLVERDVAQVYACPTCGQRMTVAPARRKAEPKARRTSNQTWLLFAGVGAAVSALALAGLAMAVMARQGGPFAAGPAPARKSVEPAAPEALPKPIAAPIPAPIPVPPDPAPDVPALVPAPKPKVPFVARADHAGWGRLIDPARDCQALFSAPDGMRLQVGPGRDFAVETGNMTAPRLTHRIEGDFQMEVDLESTPQPNFRGPWPFHGLGLCAYRDDRNYAVLMFAAFGGNDDRHVLFQQRVEAVKIEAPNRPNTPQVRSLRLTRRGRDFLASFDDGSGQWSAASNLPAFAGPLSVGVLAVNTTTAPWEAKFRRFALHAEELAP